MAEGTTCTWSDLIAPWSKGTDRPARYRQVSRGEMIEVCGRDDFGGELFDCSSDTGYDGGRKLLS